MIPALPSSVRNLRVVLDKFSLSENIMALCQVCRLPVHHPENPPYLHHLPNSALSPGAGHLLSGLLQPHSHWPSCHHHQTSTVHPEHCSSPDLQVPKAQKCHLPPLPLLYIPVNTGATQLPSNLSVQARKKLAREAIEKPTVTLKELQCSGAESESTISRLLHKTGLYKRLARKKPLLKKNHLKASGVCFASLRVTQQICGKRFCGQMTPSQSFMEKPKMLCVMQT